jgi:hypothetical protein
LGYCPCDASRDSARRRHVFAATAFAPARIVRAASRDSIQTLVAVKDRGAWRFTAFHNGRILRRAPWKWALFAIWEKIWRR